MITSKIISTLYAVVDIYNDNRPFYRGSSPRQERRRIATKQSFRTTVNTLKLVYKRRRQKTAAVIHRLLLLFFVPLHRKERKK